MGTVFGKIDVEMPKHEVLPSPGGPEAPYEIWRYPPVVAVETDYRTGDGGSRSDNAPFNRLASYIGVFGNPKNSKQSGEGAEAVAMTAPVVTTESRQVAMTAPVVTQPAQQISMTAPVVTAEESSSQGAAKTMQFLLPSQFTMQTAPKPLDPEVRLRQLPERTLAVHKFSGWQNPGLVKEKENLLLKALKADKVEVVGIPYLQQYNPPWTPGPLRRNEVVVGVKLPA